MRKFAFWVALAGVFGSCARPGIVLPVPVPVPAADILTLLVGVDGQWVISDSEGGRACLVIQESRVSILDLSCAANGSGLVARITDAPLITGGGSVIVLSATYFRRTFEDERFRLVFSGQRQADGTFVGTRLDESLNDPDAAVERSAVLERRALPGQ